MRSDYKVTQVSHKPIPFNISTVILSVRPTTPRHSTRLARTPPHQPPQPPHPPLRRLNKSSRRGRAAAVFSPKTRSPCWHQALRAIARFLQEKFHALAQAAQGAHSTANTNATQRFNIPHPQLDAITCSSPEPDRRPRLRRPGPAKPPA
jgi:hypothetical protein